MLEEIHSYSNLGTPGYFYELYQAMLSSNDKAWTSESIRSYSYNRVIDGRSVFDGCLPLALHIGFLTQNGNAYTLNPDIKKGLDKSGFINTFVRLIHSAGVNDNDFAEIFNPKKLSFSEIDKAYIVPNSSFQFRHANFRQLLLDFGVIKRHQDPGIKGFLIDYSFVGILQSSNANKSAHRHMSLDELKTVMLKEEEAGLIAEEFVVNFEKIRLNRQDVEWVSQKIVNQGYDIASFENESDEVYNRLIEVKSYSGGHPRFYWSRNEMESARLNGDKYVLYIVDRSRINNVGYTPMVIRNPYVNVLNSGNWSILEETVRVDYKGNLK